MNRIIEEELPGIAVPRDQLWELLADEHLAYKLPGWNPTFGELCIEMGQTQQVYSCSFLTLQHDGRVGTTLPENSTSVASFKVWFQRLDAELYGVLNGFSEAETHSKRVDRGHGFTPSLFVQFQIYREALLIFYGKASVYLKALEIEGTEEWKQGIG